MNVAGELAVSSRTDRKQRTSPARRSALAAVCIGFFATLASLPVQAVIAIPDNPLQSGSAVPPNILFVLDDSGSMGWDFMPDDVPGTTPVNIATQAFTRNTVYYNPGIAYQPWSNPDGSLFPLRPANSAWSDPALASGGTTNLTSSNRIFHVPNAGITDLADARQYTRYILKAGGSSAQRCTLPAPGTTWACSNITSFPWTRSNCAGSQCSIAEEWQNFATWYSYHRTRMKAAKAGASSAFSSLSRDLRVGYRTIWNRSNFDIPVASNDGLFEDTGASTNRTTWFNRLYNARASGGTPLRNALNGAGVYFQNAAASGPWGPEAGASQLACRQSFTILTTDGFWNGATPSGIGNQDGSAGSTITGPGGASFAYNPAPPFRDTVSDTLADVAMKYWKNDLRADLPNIVPTSSANPAFWQHMVTFSLSIGVSGTLNPATDLPAIEAGTLPWPVPSSNNIRNIDDLWHAAINGHGTFVAANDPQAFANGLRSALAAIVERIGSAANVATNSVSIGTDTRLFQATFLAGQWTGNLFSFAITAGGVNSTPVWSAQNGIPIPFTARRLFAEVGGSAVDLNWANLDSAKRSALNAAAIPSPGNGPAILDYLRGNTALERRNGGSFRNRNSVLGDIVNSSPALVPDNDTIFVGANDGMLHAFDARTGQEKFAFVPGGIDWSEWAKLADPQYAHRWFVDGPVVVSTRAQTGGRNILVATLGRGGKGLFALDVTTPSSFSGGDFEWSAYTDADMGFVLGRPIITRLNNGDVGVIVSNGINSSNGRPALFVYKLSTGALLKKITIGAAAPGADNGLSAPRSWDLDGNGTVDLIFAGDLQGNVWKFDLSGNAPATWKVAGGGSPIFTAKDASGNRQPIVAAPAVGVDPNDFTRWVFVATGRLLSTGDLADTKVQSMYGLIDSGSISGRSQLQQRQIIALGSSAGRSVRGFEPVGTLPSGKKGWYVDFVKPPGGTREGERVVSDLFLFGSALISATAIPSDDPCEPGGRGFVNAIDAFSGTSLNNAFFDVNGNGSFDDDTIGSGAGAVPIGSVDPGVGMLTLPAVVESVLVVGGSTGGIGNLTVNNSLPRGRISWREIIEE